MHADILDTDAALVIDARVRHAAVRRHRLWLGAGALALGTLAAVVALRARVEPVRYSTALVERRTVVQRVEISGHLEVVRRVEVPALVAGQLVAVLVRVGDRVTEGAPLALLDGQAAAIAVHAAQASLDAASGKVNEATGLLSAASDTRVRTERLFARDLASESAVVETRARESNARAVLGTARAERERARQNLRSARLSASRSSLVAPLTGVVLEAPDALGAAVGAERGSLFVLGSPLDELKIAAEVAESEVGELRPGQVAHFSVPAQPGRSFDARIERVGVEARRSTVAVRYPVELRADNHLGLLLPGMTTTVEIDVARAEDVLATRDAALRFRPDGARDARARSRVWRVTPHGLDEVPVTSGLSDGAFTEIRPEHPDALPVGSELALGLLSSDSPKTGGPGIRLGNR